MAATFRTLLALTACASLSSAASAQTVVDSIFIGQVSTSYSDPNNWSPPEVPNNSPARSYNVTVSAHVKVDMHARVSNLTATGLVISNGASLVVSETATISSSAPPEGTYFEPGVTLEGGILVVEGTLTNFHAASRTLKGGAFRVVGRAEPGGGAGILRFRGADIVHNASSIELAGPLGQILDENGLNALRNFASNTSDGEFILVGTEFSTKGDFTNDGGLTIGASRFTVTGSLTNFDAATRTLRGGAYLIGSGGTLRFAGADIVTNAASMTLAQVEPAITDLNGNDALRSLRLNDSSGRLHFFNSFTTGGSFTNAGEVSIIGGEGSGGVFTVPRGHRYLQTSGSTTLIECILEGDVEINGGVLADRRGYFPGSWINGNLTVGDALLAPDSMRIDGSLRLGSGTRYRLVPTFPYSGYPSHAPLHVYGTAAVDGVIEIEDPGEFPTASNSFATAISSRDALTGTFANAPAGSRVLTTNGRGSYLVSYESDKVVIGGYQRNPPAAQLLNISTRAKVGAGGNVTIAGFIIYGFGSDEGKKVVVRGIGPTLAAADVGGVLADPVVELHDERGNVVARNDNWKDSQPADIQASGLAPSDDREAVIVATLSRGAYTVVLRGSNQSEGVGLVEVYDAAGDARSKLANISTRGFVDAENPLIAGYISGGEGPGETELTARAIGPGLQARRVANFLPDPTLEIRDKDGALIAENDHFESPEENEERIPYSLWVGGRNAAVGLVLPPGSYTVIVRGKEGASGVALVEIYDLNR